MKKNLNLNTKKRKGFSLMELIIAVVIIGVLSAVAIPMFINTTKRANAAAFKANVEVIKTAINEYYYDKTELPTKGDDLNDYIEGGWTKMTNPANPAGSTYEIAADGTFTYKFKDDSKLDGTYTHQSARGK